MSDNDRVYISVDTMGSETPLIEILSGLNESLLRNKNLFFYIFGNEDEINKIIFKNQLFIENSKIINCENPILMSDKPSEAIRRKKNSSMVQSIEYVKNNKANACLSCGNTGALMAVSLLSLKTISNVKRPAIASIWPNLKGESIVLDLGANIKDETTSLVENAILGSTLASVIFNMSNPSVGLLNVGTEEIKGDETIQNASEIMSDLDKKSLINYYGFVEGSDISLGKTNVVVTDGFTGNVALKTAEGTARMIQNYFKNAFSSSLISKIGYFLSSLALKTVKQRLDPSVHNCGIFAGLTAPVLKCHGNSDRVGISYAADIAYSLVTNKVNEKVESILSKTYQ